MNIKKKHFYVNPKSKIRTYKDTVNNIREKVLSDFSLYGIEEAVISGVRPTSPSLISSAHGKIKKLLLTIPDYVTEEKDVTTQATGLKSLIASLPNYIELIILTHDHKPTIDKIKKWLNDSGHRGNFKIVLAEYDLNFLVWAEDAYATIKSEDSGDIYLMEPFEFKRSGDALIADYISHATDIKSSQAPVYFQGGNILIGDDFYFIGKDYPLKTLKLGSVNLTSEERKNIKNARKLYNTYLDNKRRLVFPGTAKANHDTGLQLSKINNEYFLEVHGRGVGKFQPIFHIDMFISLLGRDEENKYTVLVGDPKLASDIINENSEIEYLLSSNALVLKFKEVAEQLENEGFKVVRNPLPYIYMDSVEDDKWGYERLYYEFGEKTTNEIYKWMQEQGMDTINVREWYFATSNNVLTEITETSKTVWIPTYGYGDWQVLKHTDKLNKEIWENYGFNVVQLDDFNPFSYRLGAAHCISKYIDRDS
ncbi:MAG: hypothetical protein ACE364_04895 [Chlorobiota bacterium]